MGTHFEMLVDPVVVEADAAELCDAVIARFRKLELIVGDPNAQCVLGGEGYCPGPAVADLHKAKEGQWHFPKSSNWNGIEPRVGRNFNPWALGTVWEGFECPNCESAISRSNGFFSAVCKAIRAWVDESDACKVTCPACRRQIPITALTCKPPLGFGSLSFCFWDWPSLDPSNWLLDIPAVVAEVTGHPNVLTYGKI